ncbi:MAG: hypothetical protein AAGC93_17890 [Cyanobacteria bacterium P01_F01_bin.53]
MVQPLEASHGRDLYLHSDRELALSSKERPWRFQVAEVVSFAWVGGGSVIEYELHESGNRDLLAFWFVHIFLPLFLTLERGYDFIHAAAVEVDNQPILFLAESTGGKSTLGDFFLQRGHPMLSDDKVATLLVEGRFTAIPSHPHHRPWREAEVLGNPVTAFATKARPIHAFYILEKGRPDEEVEISEVTGFRKFESLMPNYLFDFGFLQQQRMCWLAELADRSRVFTVRRPWDLNRMQDVYESICSHSRALV